MCIKSAVCNQFVLTIKSQISFSKMYKKKKPKLECNSLLNQRHIALRQQSVVKSWFKGKRSEFLECLSLPMHLFLSCVAVH